MKSIILSAATALAVTFASVANAAPIATGLAPGSDKTAAGSEPLAALLAEWDRAGFATPNKPSQYRVYGRDGYAISGPDYANLVSLIRTAQIETREGRDATATITKARSLFAIDCHSPAR